MTPRDAMRYIRSITRRPKLEKFPTIPDPQDFAAEQKRLKCYLPTLKEIDRMKREIRAEREAKEVQEAITELVAEDDDE